MSLASGGASQPPRDAKRRGSNIAKWAIGVLTLIVLTQVVFLLSLMRAMHNNATLDDSVDDAAAPEEGKALLSTAAPRVTTNPPAPSQGVHHDARPVAASWEDVAAFFERPTLPRHHVATRSAQGLQRSLNRAERSPPELPIKKRDGPAQRDADIARRPSTAQPTLSPREDVVVAPTPPEVHTEAPSTRPSQAAHHPPPNADAPTGAHMLGLVEGNRMVQTLGDVHANVLYASNPDVLEYVAVPHTLTHLKDAALVVLCFDRPGLLERAVASVRAARLSAEVAKYISQDGDDGPTKRIAAQADGFHYLSHPRTLPPTLSALDESGQPKQTPATMYLAAHYKWVLDELFLKRKHSHVIVLEDDMRVSNDALEMFESLAPLLDIDPTLWCISSWNDNGFKVFDLPKDRFFRSSYFPGLGWMLKRSLWEDELSRAFPRDNWDHWMRATTTSRHRECVSPWRSRNYNMGVGGATSNEEFYAQFLEPIQLHRGEAVAYGDLRYLLHRDYFAAMGERILKVPTANIIAAPMLAAPAGTLLPGHQYVVHYAHEEFELLGQTLGIHPSPRSFYRRSQWIKLQGADVFLVDRRLSPFCPPSVRVRAQPGLVAVPSPRAGMNCWDTCSSYVEPHASAPEAFHCGADQFDFVNDCMLLRALMAGGCPNGCTQGWGEDIPNTEVEGVGHPPLCLATEVVPTCEAFFPFTQRLCPCVRRAAAPQGVPAARHVSEVPAPRVGMNCDEVCATFQGDAASPLGTTRWKCATEFMLSLNRCDVMRRQFPCNECTDNIGAELPSFVSNRKSGNFGKCFVTTQPTECAGFHPDTLRLCPCVPA